MIATLLGQAWHAMGANKLRTFLTMLGMIQNVPHPARPDFRALANPIRLDGERLPSVSAAALGADTEAVLRGVGYDTDAILALKSAGAL